MKTKSPYLVLFLLLNISILDGQVSSPLGELLYEDTLHLDPLHSLVEIPKSDSNIWNIGFPGYKDIDSTFSGRDAIFVDTSKLNIDGNENYFIINLPAADSGWGEGILSFYHNFYTDTLMNGGFIEVSYDNGQSWINVIDDVNHITYNFIGLYSVQDTIRGMIPAYSGKAESWVYTELYWHWIALVKKTGQERYGYPKVKFKFMVSSDVSSLNTWILDEMVVRGYSIIGNTNNSHSKDVKVFPNPASKVLYVRVPTETMGYDLEIIDLTGKIFYQNKFMKSIQVDPSFLESGIYIVQLKQNGRLINSTKFVKD